MNTGTNQTGTDYLNEWLDFAETDLKTARLLYKKGQKIKNGSIFFRYSLYHLEQAGEKIGKVCVWQVAKQLYLTCAFVGSEAVQKYRKTVRVIEKLAKAKGKDFGHTPSAAFRDINKFLYLYKEGEAFRLIMDFMNLTEETVLKTLKPELGSDQERLLKEQLQVLKESLRKHQETVKVDDIKKEKVLEPLNYEKLKAGIGFCDRLDPVFDKIIQTAELKIDDFAPKIELFIESYGIELKMLRRTLKDFKGFFISMVSSWKGFVDSTVLWDSLSRLVEARYPDLQLDNRIYGLIPDLDKRMSQILRSARPFNRCLLEIQNKIPPIEEGKA